ncbi:MAG: GIY-YIG nuclease family protein [Chitinophagales bacterium]|nr:GIY-YIG nuclease family protein [Chitinophagales bacterium]
MTTNPRKTVFYVGVTNNIERRLKEHFENRGKTTTHAGKYFCYNLVHYEVYPDIIGAIAREKEIKLLSRQKKIELIRTSNPYLNFLTQETWQF